MRGSEENNIISEQFFESVIRLILKLESPGERSEPLSVGRGQSKRL